MCRFPSLLLIFLVFFISNVVPITQWAFQRKTSLTWDACVALLTRLFLHPPWMLSHSKEATGLLCVFHHSLFGLFYPQTSSLSEALFPHLPEDARQGDTSLSLTLFSLLLFRKVGFALESTCKGLTSRDSWKVTFHNAASEGALL